MALLLKLALGGWSFLKGLPWQVWAGVAALLAVWFAWHWHTGQVKKADKAGYARAMGEVRAHAEQVAAEARLLAARAQTLQATINSNVRSDYVEKSATARTRADALRLRVPDSLQCPAGNAAVPGSASGASGQAEGRDLSGMAVIPWRPLVDRGEQCDIYRAQVEGWQSWYGQQSAAWEQWRKAFAKALAAPPK